VVKGSVKKRDLLALEDWSRQDIERLLSLKNGDLREEDGKLILTPHVAEASSPELDNLRRLIDSRLPKRDITDVLVEVDNWTGYSDAFIHLDGVQTRGRDLLLNLYGCLLAQACNLGFKPLADAAALPYNKLLWCNRWYVRDETLTEATATLVTFMQGLPYSGVWGSGLLSSSDGQRFAAKGDIRKARALPRYYGYGKGVTFYTWTLEQAAALLEGLLVNHAFVDGNKRVAFAVADVFLRLNGFLIATSTDDAYDVIIEALASGGDRFDRLDAWLRGHVEELP
jgi:hypothetical protein